MISSMSSPQAGATAAVAWLVLPVVTDPGAPVPDRKVSLNPYGELTSVELGETVATVGNPCVMLPVRYIVDDVDGDDQVTAYFPTIFYDEHRNNNVVCYAHYGQHGEATPGYLEECRQATPAEYAELHAELTGIYDDVVLQVEPHNS